MKLLDGGWPGAEGKCIRGHGEGWESILGKMRSHWRVYFIF